MVDLQTEKLEKGADVCGGVGGLAVGLGHVCSGQTKLQTASCVFMSVWMCLYLEESRTRIKTCQTRLEPKKQKNIKLIKHSRHTGNKACSHWREVETGVSICILLQLGAENVSVIETRWGKESLNDSGDQVKREKTWFCKLKLVFQMKGHYQILHPGFWLQVWHLWTGSQDVFIKRG